MQIENSWLSRLTKKNGYYELDIENFEELILLINPTTHNLRSLMTDLKFDVEPGESVPLSFLRNVGPLRPMVNDEIIFRGQADSSWTLTPSIYRNECFINQSIDPRDIVKAEYENLMSFQKLCDLGGVQIPADSYTHRRIQKEVIENFSTYHLQDFWHDSFIEVAAFAQHFGIETSLLDWSRNILTASYFATTGVFYNYINNEKYCENSHSFSIWVLNNKYFDSKYIKIIEPPKSINSHIANQQGILSITKINDNILNKKSKPYRSSEDLSMERMIESFNKDHLMLKINISILFAQELYDYCNSFKFNAISLFGGIHGIKQYIDDSRMYDKFVDKFELNLRINDIRDMN